MGGKCPSLPGALSFLDPPTPPRFEPLTRVEIRPTNPTETELASLSVSVSVTRWTLFQAVLPRKRPTECWLKDRPDEETEILRPSISERGERFLSIQSGDSLTVVDEEEHSDCVRCLTDDDRSPSPAPRNGKPNPAARVRSIISSYCSCPTQKVALVEYHNVTEGRYVCANGGNCTHPGVCECAAGWSGFDCRTPICSQVNRRAFTAKGRVSSCRAELNARKAYLGPTTVKRFPPSFDFDQPRRTSQRSGAPVASQARRLGKFRPTRRPDSQNRPVNRNRMLYR